MRWALLVNFRRILRRAEAGAAYCLFGSVLWLLPLSAHAEIYVGGSVGLGLYGDGGPQNYFRRNDVGVTRSEGSFNPLRASVLGGVWMGRNWGLELSGEVGPFNKGSGSISSLYYPDYSEDQTYWAVFLTPEFRSPVVPGTLDLVVGAPIGYQFLSGSVSNRFSTYEVSGSSIAFGLNVRLEYMATKRTFGFLSAGYIYGKIPALNYAYPPNLFGGGVALASSSSLPRILNENPGVDLSGVRLNIGLGFKWGFGQKSARMPAV